jgi:hypothetical protein
MDNQKIMKKQNTNQATMERGQKSQIPHYSDGSELIPSEIKSDLQNNDDLVAGYTKDDEGIINNYALEPAMSATTYPTPKQQFRYVFLGAGAIVFVATLLLIAVAVS